MCCSLYDTTSLQYLHPRQFLFFLMLQTQPLFSFSPQIKLSSSPVLWGLLFSFSPDVCHNSSSSISHFSHSPFLCSHHTLPLLTPPPTPSLATGRWWLFLPVITAAPRTEPLLTLWGFCRQTHTHPTKDKRWFFFRLSTFLGHLENRSAVSLKLLGGKLAPKLACFVLK